MSILELIEKVNNKYSNDLVKKKNYLKIKQRLNYQTNPLFYFKLYITNSLKQTPM